MVELNCFTIRGFVCGSSKGVSRMGGARPSRLMYTVVLDTSIKLGTCLGETSWNIGFFASKKNEFIFIDDIVINRKSYIGSN